MMMMMMMPMLMQQSHDFARTGRNPNFCMLLTALSSVSLAQSVLDGLWKTKIATINNLPNNM
eukprot:486834-Amphidinium_carterae.1